MLNKDLEPWNLFKFKQNMLRYTTSSQGRHPEEELHQSVSAQEFLDQGGGFGKNLPCYHFTSLTDLDPIAQKLLA